MYVWCLGAAFSASIALTNSRWRRPDSVTNLLVKTKCSVAASRCVSRRLARVVELAEDNPRAPRHRWITAGVRETLYAGDAAKAERAHAYMRGIGLESRVVELIAKEGCRWAACEVCRQGVVTLVRIETPSCAVCSLAGQRALAR